MAIVVGAISLAECRPVYADGGWIHVCASERPNETVLEITAQRPGGRRFERRLVLEK